MTGRKNYKSKVGEIFVYFKTVELLLVRWQLQGDDGTVPDSSWTSLSHAEFSLIEMALAINALALNVLTAISIKRENVCSRNVFVDFYIQKVTWNVIFYFILVWWGVNSSCFSKKIKLFLEIFISGTLK